MLLVNKPSPLLSRDLCSLFQTLPFSSYSSTIAPSGPLRLAGLNTTTAQMALMETCPGSIPRAVCP